MHDEHQVPIWFFIGCLLLVYGILIFGVGVYHFVSPPPVAERVALYDLHSDVWWGALMIVVGGFYVVHYRPDGEKPATPGDRARAGS